MPPEPKKDQFAFSNASLPACSVPFVAVFHSFLPMVGELFWFIEAVVLACWLLVMIFHLAGAMWKHLWKRCGSILAVIVFVFPLIGISIWSADYIHLAVDYPFYASKVSEAARDYKPAEFKWGGTGFVGSSQTENTLIYDPSDKLEDEVGLRKLPGVDVIWQSVRHLIGHFYVVQMTF